MLQRINQRKYSKMAYEFSTYKPHPLVHKHLLQLLQQYCESPASDIPLLSSCFLADGSVVIPPSLRIIMHPSISVDSRGYFSSYKPFDIMANGKYGKDARMRERFDVIEVTIPESAGGSIAGSTELLRFNSDTAPARVLGIFTVEFGSKDACFMVVMFFRRGISPGLRNTKKYLCASQKRGLRLFRNLIDIYYGIHEPTWIAIYPLATMTAPVLCLPDVNYSNSYVVYHMRYLHRGIWQNELSDRIQYAHSLRVTVSDRASGNTISEVRSEEEGNSEDADVW